MNRTDVERKSFGCFAQINTAALHATYPVDQNSSFTLGLVSRLCYCARVDRRLDSSWKPIRYTSNVSRRSLGIRLDHQEVSTIGHDVVARDFGADKRQPVHCGGPASNVPLSALVLRNTRSAGEE